MKILLVFPPQMEPYMPALSVPWLSAYLRSAGHEVVQRDLNVETYHLLLSERFLTSSLNKVREQLAKIEALDDLPWELLPKYRFLSKIASAGEYIIDRIAEAKGVYTSWTEFFHPEKLIESHKLMEGALRLALAPWYPAHLSFNQFCLDADKVAFTTEEALVADICDREHNPFQEIFREYLLDSMLAEEPDLIGISMSGCYQPIPGLTLAALIKEKSDAYVCVGGQSISRWEDVLPRATRLFDFFDGAVVREGEIPLLRLVTALEQGDGLETVPNLIYRENGNIKHTPLTKMIDMDSMPVPDFDGLPLDSYFMPRLMLPLYIGRGCYYRQCVFCDHVYGYENYYVHQDLDLVKRNIVALSQKHGTNLMPVVDEIMPPQLLRSFAEMLVDGGLDVKYFMAQRCEDEYTPELFDLCHRSGLMLLIWGVESACQRVLDLMNKGRRVEANERVLRQAAGAGIWNYAAIVHGFPGVRREEEEQTIEYVVKHADIVKGVFSNVFGVAKGSVILHEPERFGVRLQSLGEFCTWYVHQAESGLTQREALNVQADLMNRVREAHPNFEFWHTLDWPHVFLYLVRYGYEKVANMCVRSPAVELPVDGRADTVVRLRDGVFHLTQAFDPSADPSATVKKSPCCALYDLLGDELFFVSPQAAEMLAQCARGERLGNLVAQTQTRLDMPWGEIEAIYTRFVERLAQKNLVVFSCAEWFALETL